MILEQIKEAVDAGKIVNWMSSAYEVIKDSKGQYLIRYVPTNDCVGLTDSEGNLTNEPYTFFLNRDTTKGNIDKVYTPEFKLQLLELVLLELNKKVKDNTIGYGDRGYLFFLCPITEIIIQKYTGLYSTASILFSNHGIAVIDELWKRRPAEATLYSIWYPGCEAIPRIKIVQEAIEELKQKIHS